MTRSFHPQWYRHLPRLPGFACCPPPSPDMNPVGNLWDVKEGQWSESPVINTGIGAKMMERWEKNKACDTSEAICETMSQQSKAKIAPAKY